MIDISDGLSIDLSRLLKASAVAARLQLDRVPVGHLATLDDALGGGEDYELLAALPDPDAVDAAASELKGSFGVPLTEVGVVVEGEDVRRLQGIFQVDHFVRLPALLESSLVDFIQSRLAQGSWQPMSHGLAGDDIVSTDVPVNHALHFLANAPAFLDAVRIISGCGDITWLDGRIIRLSPNPGRYDSWHDDVDGHRRVGMSLNLSPHGFQGGVFQLRDPATHRVLAEYANTGLGDAVLFRISPELEHQVTPVEGSSPRTAFVGWFQSGKATLLDRLKATASGRS